MPWACVALDALDFSPSFTLASSSSASVLVHSLRYWRTRFPPTVTVNPHASRLARWPANFHVRCLTSATFLSSLLELCALPSTPASPERLTRVRRETPSTPALHRRSSAR